MAEASYRQLYEGQRAVVRELQQSQHLKDELYNVVSHELRTPLTGILGFGELLLVRDGQLSPAQRKDHLGRILREARRLQRVVDNLVFSSKVIREDGGAATDVGAVVHAVIEDLDDLPGRDRVAVEVSNAGQPIPPADRERIFQPFVQLDSSTTRTASGVGLGLHIVRRLVESFGGTVEVDSDVAGMVTFTVRVPMASRRRDPARLGGSPSSHLRSSGGSI